MLKQFKSHLSSGKAVIKSERQELAVLHHWLRCLAEITSSQILRGSCSFYFRSSRVLSIRPKHWGCKLLDFFLFNSRHGGKGMPVVWAKHLWFSWHIKISGHGFWKLRLAQFCTHLCCKPNLISRTCFSRGAGVGNSGLDGDVTSW